MKINLILLSILFLQSSSWAQNDLIFDLTPTTPAFCALQDYPTVNTIYASAKTEEDKTHATFEFLTAEGACKDGDFNMTELDPNNVNFEIYQNDFLWPWLHERVKLSYEVLPNSVVRVKLVFDTLRIFKHKRTQKFTMNFEANGRTHHISDLRSYQWTIELMQTETLNTELKFDRLR